MNAVDVPEDAMRSVEERDFTVNEATSEDPFHVFFFVVDGQLKRLENKDPFTNKILNLDGE